MIVDTQYRDVLIPLFALISQKYGKKWARIARDVLPYRGRVSLRSRWTFLQVDLVLIASTPSYDVFGGGTIVCQISPCRIVRATDGKDNACGQGHPLGDVHHVLIRHVALYCVRLWIAFVVRPRWFPPVGNRAVVMASYFQMFQNPKPDAEYFSASTTRCFFRRAEQQVLPFNNPNRIIVAQMQMQMLDALTRHPARA